MIRKIIQIDEEKCKNKINEWREFYLYWRKNGLSRQPETISSIHVNPLLPLWLELSRGLIWQRSLTIQTSPSQHPLFLNSRPLRRDAWNQPQKSLADKRKSHSQASGRHLN